MHDKLSGIAEVNQYKQVITLFSSTFSEFYRIFPENKQSAVEVIYSFLRIFDTLVDYRGADQERFYELKNLTLNSIESSEKGEAVLSGITFVDDLVKVAKKYGFARCEFQTFIESMEMDLNDSYSPKGVLDNKKRVNIKHNGFTLTLYPQLEKSVSSDGDFGRYIEGSAGVVGLWMAKIMLYDEVSNTQLANIPEKEVSQVLKGAQLMGDIFQIINFLRDLKRDMGLINQRLENKMNIIDRDFLELQARLYVPPLNMLSSTKSSEYSSIWGEYLAKQKNNQANADNWLVAEVITIFNNTDDSNRIYEGLIKVIEMIEQEYLPVVEPELHKLPTIPQLAVKKTLDSYRNNVLEKLKNNPEKAIKDGEAEMKPGKVSIFFGIISGLAKLSLTRKVDSSTRQLARLKLRQLTQRFFSKVMGLKSKKLKKINDKVGYYALFYNESEFTDLIKSANVKLNDSEIKRIKTVQKLFRAET